MLFRSSPLRGRDQVDGGEDVDLLIVDYSSNTYAGASPAAGITCSIYSNGSGGFNGYYSAYYNSSYGYDQVSFSNIETFQITGTSANETIRTGSGNDTINSGAGNDSIDAAAGDDSINSGGGNDSIDAGAGNDSIDAGDGNDTIASISGIDTIDGGSGLDTLIDGRFGAATTGLTFDDQDKIGRAHV